MAVVTTALIQYDGMTEKELDHHIRQLASDLGLFRYHVTDSRGTSAGFPDLVLVGPGGVIFAELKSARGQLRPEQTEWRDRLTEAGATWRLWRPADLASGDIARELAAISYLRLAVTHLPGQHTHDVPASKENTS
jgi:hypothetical protein